MRYLLLCGILLSNWFADAQSCCSGGVPISNNLGLPSVDARVFQLAVSYDLNVLNTLKSGAKSLADNTRKRTTHSAIAQLGYQATSKLSFDLLVPYVRQERKLTPVDQAASFDASNGIGDIVALAKYQVISGVSVGLGIKSATGSASEKNHQGLQLSADLQPGSGAWDMIYWLGFNHHLKSRPTANLSLIGTYRATGENKNYFDNQSYEFGNEIQATLNYSEQLLLGQFIINPSIGMRYRHVSSDQTNGSAVPGTGGNWLFVRPVLSYEPGQLSSIQVAVDIPAYAHVKGVQVTPTYRLNIAFYKKFRSSKSLSK